MLINATTKIVHRIIGGTQGTWGDGGPAIQAAFQTITSIFLKPDASELYICDSWNYVVRVVSMAASLVNLFAGSYSRLQGGANGDGGQATSAAFYFPYAVWLDADNNAFISDPTYNNIRRVDGT